MALLPLEGRNMIWVILYSIGVLVCFTVFGLSTEDIDMWKVLALSLVWPITIYWLILAAVSAVLPWKV